MMNRLRFFVVLLTALVGTATFLTSAVDAARLSSMSATLTDHTAAAASNYTISYRSASGVAVGTGVISLHLSDVVSSLNSITVDDIDLIAGGSQLPLAAAADNSNWGVTLTPASRLVQLNAPLVSNSISEGLTVTIRIGTHATSGATGTRQMKNSSSSGSRLISIVSGADVGLLSVVIGSFTTSVSGSPVGTGGGGSGAAAAAPAASTPTTETAPSSGATTTTEGGAASSGQQATTTPTQEPQAPPPANRAPSVNAGADRTITLPSQASLSGTASDPDGDTTTVNWSKVSGAGTVTFSAASALATNASFSQAGTYVLRLTVSDGKGGSATDDVQITVNPANRAPSVNAGLDLTLTLPSAAILDATVSDPDGDAVVVSWAKVSGPGTVAFGNANAVATTASFSEAGSYVLRLSASDGKGGTATDELQVTVNPAPPPPEKPKQEGEQPPADTTAPAPVTTTDLGFVSDTTVTISWLAPSDTDGTGATRNAARYEIRYSTAPITTESEWQTALVAPAPPLPLSPGVQQSYTLQGLQSGKQYYIVIRAYDEADNISPSSVGISAMTNFAVANAPLTSLSFGTINGEASVPEAPPLIIVPKNLSKDAIVEKLPPPRTIVVVPQGPVTPATSGGFGVPPPVAPPTAVDVSYEVDSRILVQAVLSSDSVPNAPFGFRTQISAQPLQLAQYWMNMLLPGPQLADKEVVGKKAFFIRAERLETEHAADISVSTLAQPVPIKFCFTKKELEGFDATTLRTYSFDPIDGIRPEETLWDEATGCATATVNHFSAFAVLGDRLFDAKPIQIYILPTEILTKEESTISTETLKLEDFTTKEQISFFDKKIYTTPDTEISLCIPASTFVKPVKKMSLFIGDKKHTLEYDKRRDCYAAKIRTPEKRGAQQVVLKIIYTDDQVQIIELETIVTGKLQAALLPRVQQAARQIQEAAIVVNETVKETVEDTKPILQSAVVVSMPVVTAVNPTLYTSALNWYHYLNHLIAMLLTWIGLRKRRKPWGVVYNAISKQAVDLAIVRLFDKDKKLVETQVTDKEGRFSFLPKPGEYTIDVKKPPFVFPSSLITGTSDGDYASIYRGASVTLTKTDESIILNVPIDPPAPEQKGISAWEKIKGGFTQYSRITLLANLVVSALLAIYTPEPFNVILLAVTYAFALYQIALMHRFEKPWGIVFDALSLEPIPLAAISIFNADSKKLLRQRLTDYVGRFNFLAPAGDYLLQVSKDAYAFPPSTPVKIKKYKNMYTGGTVKVSKDKAIVKINIPLEPKADVQPVPNTAQSDQQPAEKH
ncbi:fibronectin type III domain-containing protein [Candidatus Uhrbacteria bacterium]|nr:fibronectin type III domain-containing protein [Candidatus Uhrbacteria bacterium]